MRFGLGLASEIISGLSHFSPDFTDFLDIGAIGVATVCFDKRFDGYAKEIGAVSSAAGSEASGIDSAIPGLIRICAEVLARMSVSSSAANTATIAERVSVK